MVWRLGGTNLGLVKKEIDFYQQLAKTHSHPILATHMQWYQDTVTSFLDCSSESTTIALANADECNITDATSIHINQLCLLSLYLGQYERVEFLVKKFEKLEFDERNRMPIRNILVSFYYGLALTGLYRQKQNRGLYKKRQNKQSLSAIKSAIGVLVKGE